MAILGNFVCIVLLVVVSRRKLKRLLERLLGGEEELVGALDRVEGLIRALDSIKGVSSLSISDTSSFVFVMSSLDRKLL